MSFSKLFKYKIKDLKVDGQIKVQYCVICKSDVNIEIKLSDLLSNEKIEKAIKSEFAKGLRNIVLTSDEESLINVKTDKQIYEFVVDKNDFADLVSLAEDDAQKKKLLKKDCDGIELLDFITLD